VLEVVETPVVLGFQYLVSVMAASFALIWAYFREIYHTFSPEGVFLTGGWCKMVSIVELLILVEARHAPSVTPFLR
jgi:hypothetical protein